MHGRVNDLLTMWKKAISERKNWSNEYIARLGGVPMKLLKTSHMSSTQALETAVKYTLSVNKTQVFISWKLYECLLFSVAAGNPYSFYRCSSNIEAEKTQDIDPLESIKLRQEFPNGIPLAKIYADGTYRCALPGTLFKNSDNFSVYGPYYGTGRWYCECLEAIYEAIASNAVTKFAGCPAYIASGNLSYFDYKAGMTSWSFLDHFHARYYGPDSSELVELRRRFPLLDKEGWHINENETIFTTLSSKTQYVISVIDKKLQESVTNKITGIMFYKEYIENVYYWTSAVSTRMLHVASINGQEIK